VWGGGARCRGQRTRCPGWPSSGVGYFEAAVGEGLSRAKCRKTGSTIWRAGSERERERLWQESATSTLSILLARKEIWVGDDDYDGSEIVR